MMRVEVQVPMLDANYEFELDEEKSVRTLLGDIILLVEQREKVRYVGSGDACLYAWDQECILNREESLRVQGIRNGAQLLLL